MSAPDAVVVGSGPNGLAAALTLARNGWSVLVIEGAAKVGGGCRTAELTEPGFAHDVCSSVHPLLAASPFFAGVGLGELGVRLLRPRASFAQPLGASRAAVAWHSLDDTVEGLGPDGPAYRRLMGPLTDRSPDISAAFLSPMRRIPPRPIGAASLLRHGVGPVTRLARRFDGTEAPALLSGVAGHAGLRLEDPLTGAFALLLSMLGHSVGWPVVEGGSMRIAEGLSNMLIEAGGRVEAGRWVDRLTDVPAARAVLFDVTPRQLLEIAGPVLSGPMAMAYRRYRYGPGVCKVDWALSEPVPWSAPACGQAATVHLGGTLDEVAVSEREVAAGRHPESPYCIVVQPTVVDPTRAPPGRHTLWAYCHVPGGSDVDMTSRIEAQIERFAPGFADTVLARATSTAADLERYNPTCVGGDINGGAFSVRQVLARPVPRWNPYRSGIPGVYLCSASTPPGGGVHGMCGYHAAKTVMADEQRGRLATHWG